ncbi:hypothetical protein GCM10009809_07110 [Isoptericola hypogeus]|uniref:Ferritin-like domain-containing protein n=1 Tax=Isoptericola hypogeus TaxID=300179 RepID=A0ABP4UWP6_9MICO
MSEQGGTPGTDGTTTGAPGGGTAALAGLAAYTELAAFGLLASRSVDAPDLVTRQALAAAAGGVLDRQRRLLAVAADRGLDAAEAMAPFDGVLADFDARTTPGSWQEGLLKGVVGHGVAQDLCRELAVGLPSDEADALRAAVRQEDADDPATTVLAEAAAADGVLASRLALWGRRVVGEALGLVPTLLAAHPALAGLAEAARSRAAADGGTDRAGEPAGRRAGADRSADVQAWLMARLTAQHTRRMDRMRLAA